MAQLFSLSKGARLPSQAWILTSTATFNLALRDNIKFVYRKRDVDERVEATLNVVDEPTALVRFDPGAADVDEVGVFECCVEVTFAGKVMRFPHEGFDTFAITEAIE